MAPRCSYFSPPAWDEGEGSEDLEMYTSRLPHQQVQDERAEVPARANQGRTPPTRDQLATYVRAAPTVERDGVEDEEEDEEDDEDDGRAMDAQEVGVSRVFLQ